MTHFFTIAFDHRLQFFDIFRCDLSLDEAIQAIKNRQHPENKIDTDIHNPGIVTQLKGEQYREFEQARLARTGKHKGRVRLIEFSNCAFPLRRRRWHVWPLTSKGRNTLR